MQASNFGGTFDQFFLWIFFMRFSHKMRLYLFYTMVQKSQKWPNTQIKGVLIFVVLLKFLAGIGWPLQEERQLASRYTR